MLNDRSDFTHGVVSPEGQRCKVDPFESTFQVGSIATHGDVVQWGEAVAVVLTRSDESSWAMIWRNELRTRGIRSQPLLLVFITSRVE